MARVEKVELLDDITGEPAEVTVQFSYRGKGYEIDLSAENEAEFASAIAGYIESARPLGKVLIGTRTTLPTVRGAGADRDRARQIRTWARENGVQVSERGRIPTEVVQQWERHTA